MNQEKIKELAKQVGYLPDMFGVGHWDMPEFKRFAELIVTEAFRAGMLYSAKKYSEVGQERFIGNDVSLFLEMEAVELTDDEIIQHFCIEK